MVRTGPPLWICVTAVFLWGCKDQPAPAVKVVAKQEVKVDYAAQLPVGGNMAEQLQVESAARPQDALKAESVIEALSKSEISVGNGKQFIARPVLATYCFGGTTPKATSVTICEYASVDAAKAGLEHSQKQFGSIPHRSLTQNKQTVMTLVRDVDSPETKAEADKAIEVFGKL
jgi:Tfp pilus assembly protein PilV